MNKLYYGDNLVILKRLTSDSVDLIYLDPPFNSKRNYNVIFARSSGDEPAAQIQAFDDTWHWTHEVETHYSALLAGEVPGDVADALTALRTLLGESDAMAYLVNMAPRLVELRRVLKPTGSIYLHCDPTMSHYLKVLMDAIFGPENFLNHVVWLYGLGGSSARYWPRKHDDLLWYSKEPDGQYFKADMVPARSQRMKGQDKKAPDYWDIPTINNMAKERLGYPTQKPEALLERVVRSSCPEDGVVLDPFCGCGTTVAAAEKLGRRWIGIDITYVAIDLIEKRLIHTFGDEISATYEVDGVPEDLAGAQALFDHNAFDFERWAVSLADGTPNKKQQGDRGVDGVARFPVDAQANVGRCLISVKGGKQIGPAFVRDLVGTVESQKAEMGLLITLAEPTRGMREAADHAGTYRWPVDNREYPRVQIITVAQLLAGDRPNMPPTLLPYIQAQRQAAEHDQLALGD